MLRHMLIKSISFVKLLNDDIFIIHSTFSITLSRHLIHDKMCTHHISTTAYSTDSKHCMKKIPCKLAVQQNNRKVNSRSKITSISVNRLPITNQSVNKRDPAQFRGLFAYGSTHCTRAAHQRNATCVRRPIESRAIRSHSPLIPRLNFN